jgi:hypothetical protein
MMNGLGPGRSVSPQGLHPPPLIRRKLKKRSALAYFYVLPLHVPFVLFVVVCVLLSRG